MLTFRSAYLGVGIVVAVSGLARADVGTLEPAALLIYPYVAVSAADGIDTLVQITNVGVDPVDVRCFYVDTLPHCAGGQEGQTCFPTFNCVGTCVPDVVITLFDFRLTARQPISWRASQGLASLPLESMSGPGSQFNSGSIAAATRDPSLGHLRCLAVDAAGLPVDRNVLFGDATVEQRVTGDAATFTAASYAAISIPAIAGAMNGDDTLSLGGASGEYVGCPETNVLPHLFDGAVLSATDLAPARRVFSTLVLVPCSAQFSTPAHMQSQLAEFFVFNEFEQRFAAARLFSWQEVRPLSAIDTQTPEAAPHSIFNIGVSGTLSGQIRVFSSLSQPRPANTGFFAMLLETYRPLESDVPSDVTAVNAEVDGNPSNSDQVHLSLTITESPTLTPPPSTPTPTAETPMPSPTSTAIATSTATVTSPPPSPTPTRVVIITATPHPSPTRTVTPSASPTVSTVPTAPPTGSSGCSAAPLRAADPVGAATIGIAVALLWARRRRPFHRWAKSSGRAMFALLALLAAGSVQAQPTQHGGSVLIFPRIVASDSTDTVIQIVNGTDATVRARCDYINAIPTNPELPLGPLNPPLWTDVDFQIDLTAQQSTHWIASRGRPAINEEPAECIGEDGTPVTDCDGFGTDPGNIPPVAQFQGELICVEVDADGLPQSGNSLRGVSTIRDEVLGVSKNAAIALRGLETNDGDGVLCIGGEVSEVCPNGAEYRGCTDLIMFEHLADGSEDPLAGPGSAITNFITLAPCGHNLTRQVPATVTAVFLITNELEQSFSTATTITCWQNIKLTDIGAAFGIDVLATPTAHTRVRPAEGSGPFLASMQSVRLSLAPPMATSTGVAVRYGGEEVPAQIDIPLEIVQP